MNFRTAFADALSVCREMARSLVELPRRLSFGSEGDGSERSATLARPSPPRAPPRMPPGERPTGGRRGSRAAWTGDTCDLPRAGGVLGLAGGHKEHVSYNRGVERSKTSRCIVQV